MQNMRRRPDFYEKNALQARLIKQNVPQAGFSPSVLMGTLSY